MSIYFWMFSTVIALISCGDKDSDTGGENIDDTNTTEDTDTSVDTGTTEDPDPAVDSDGDGFSTNDGDCNDEDATIFPYDRSAHNGNVGCGWEVSTGIGYVCGLSSAGEISCWGDDNDAGNLEAPQGTFVELSVGTSHACARDANNLLTCWGWGTFGQTGLYEESGSLLDTPVKSVVSGGYQTCAINMNDRVECMGGYNAANWDWPEMALSSLQVSNYHGCAIAEDGHIECVIPTDDSGTAIFELTDEVPAGTYTAVASIYDGLHCALTDQGGVTCWGEYGSAMTPPTSGVQSLKAGSTDHFCALMEDQSVSCWGGDIWGPDISQYSAPEETFQSIDLSDTFTCGVTTSGRIQCWGAYEGDPATW